MRERTQLAGEVGADVTGVLESERLLDGVEVAVEGEGALGGPPLVQRRLADTGQAGHPFEGQVGDPFLQEYLSDHAEDVRADLVGRAAPTTAGRALGGALGLLRHDVFPRVSQVGSVQEAVPAQAPAGPVLTAPLTCEFAQAYSGPRTPRR